jgi:pSer/pThr/pTyr-binding forkhead associated (FHA) protein/Mg-chelatase subunit ChlD
MKRALLVLMILSLFYIIGHEPTAQQKSTKPLDLVLVLDNSGSMRANDPQFLTKKVVTSFFDGLADGTRMAFVLFADKAELVMPLTAVADAGVKEKVGSILKKVNYRGMYTDIPAAVERAVYELKQNGRQDAERLIIFMTDGVIDIGNRAKELEKSKWLKEGLAEEGRKAGIRIFGVAFADKADFELIQTLAQKTEGGYYRALKSDDIQGVFTSINQAISQAKPKLPTTTATAESPQPEAARSGAVVTSAVPQESGFSMAWMVVIGLLAVGMVAVVLAVRRRAPQPGVVPEEPMIEVPEAELKDVESVTGRSTVKLNKRVARVGRVARDGVSICINRPTVSDPHAEIRYDDYNFYLIDLDSTNGTYLNGEEKRVPKYLPMPLKDGDVLTFDVYRFEFRVPGQSRRGNTEIRKKPTNVVSKNVKASAGAPHQAGKAGRKGAAAPVSQAEPQTAMCAMHPSFRATEICPVCQKSFCPICIAEKEGKRICIQCAA